MPLMYNTWVFTLWGSDMLCAYHNPCECEQLRIDTLIYIVRLPYIFVARNALFTYGTLVGFCPWLYSKSYSENRLIKAIPVVALHDDLSNWNVNNLLSKHCVYF